MTDPRSSIVAPFVARMLALLFPTESTEPADGSPNLDVYPDIWDDLDSRTRPGAEAARHGYPYGLAKSKWMLRDRLGARRSLRMPGLSRRERLDDLRGHEALTRALELERLLGSFHQPDGDSFPLDDSDRVADSLVLWLDHLGFSLVPHGRDQDEALPQAESVLPLVFDLGNRTVILLRKDSIPGRDASPIRLAD